MKKFFMQGLVLTFVLLFAVSCQKESKSLTQGIGEQAIASKAEFAGGCRMTSYDYYNGIGDYHNIDYFTYKNGLVDVVYPYYGWRYDMVYNEQKKLIGSNVYIDETLVAIVSFVYENNKAVQEIWRNPETGEIEDHYFNSYDQQGNLIRNESFITDTRTDYTYTANGSLESWFIIFQGMPWQKGEYTYETNYKNPFRSLTGIEYTFWYTNSGFGIGTGHRWYSSEKITLYDENGDPFTYYEQDPALTTWQGGQQHYPIRSDYVDKSSQALIINSFEYENCNPGQASQNARMKPNRVIENNSPSIGSKPFFIYPQKNAIKKLRR